MLRIPMQIEVHQLVCPVCGSAGLEMAPVLHHMMCAYVGPQYDFIPADGGYTCPKCRRDIVSGDVACEIVGTSARCVQCGKEMMMSPPSVPHVGGSDAVPNPAPASTR